MMKVERRWALVRSPTKTIVFCICLSNLVYEAIGQVFANRPPQPGNFPNFLVKSESTPVGSILGNISATDSDGPVNISFSIPNQLTTTSQLVELSNLRKVDAATWAMDIVLKHKLDRDFEQPQRKLTFSATDGQSTIALEVTLMIQDVNDEAPLLINLPYKVTISENEAVGKVIFSNISAFDPDNGRGSTIEYSLTTDAQGADEEYRTTFSISSTNGNITLERKLDYEEHSFYIFKIGVKDQGDPSPLTGIPADFVVTVLDVQDTPPVFVNLPYNHEIKETLTVGSSVLKVTAMDGDHGIPNGLSYSFVSGDYQNFEIDSVTGLITVKASLDRDSSSMASTGGVYAMYVQAEEIDKPGQPNYGNTTAKALVTILVTDVNDHLPEFSQSHYTAQIQENMLDGVPVTFLGDVMRVADADQGTNSHFSLSVEKDGQKFDDFTTLPEEVYQESTVLLRVNNSGALDYEKERQIVFQVVAREIDTTEKRSSTATVTLNILDMNDNAPNFTHSLYLFEVSENASVGYSIGQILATDDDNGSYARVSYSIRGGNEKFRIDRLSGSLFVNGALDRETTSEYYLTAEAMDGGGLRAPTEIQITITDVNDNPPVFRRSDYEGIVRERDSEFLRPIILEAVDDDARGTANSQVHYLITQTTPGLESNFSIDNSSGQITLRAPLDYEKLDPALKGKLVLVVVARDSGIPAMSSSVFVNVTVEDVNDFPPVFSPSTYTKHLVENAPEDTSVLTVTATDQDGTSPNKDFFYRIESGALDKFRIDFGTGEIFVESGAKLDREEKKEYYLRVSATDRGNSPLTGFSNVTIIIDNVNDEMPRFSQSSEAVTISESLAVGQIVFSYVAVDSDDDSNLHYSLLENQTRAFDEKGETVDPEALGVNNYFNVHANNGSIYVASALDRETAERIVVKILVEDLNAAVPSHQSATATLTITLTDFNDNPPSFEPTSQFRVNVSEAESINSVILQVLTFDPDRGQRVTYDLARFIDDASGMDSFSIGESSGIVSLQRKLDREAKPAHTFIIVAKDSGVPQLSSSATVYVTVLDYNDNVPEFVAYPTEFQVPENASVGYVIYTMSANDLDAGYYGLVSYSLEGVDNENGNFQINSSTGKLTVIKQLDRETKDLYRLDVLARDSDPDIVNQKSRRAPLRIHITDINDNSPQFQPLGSSSPTVAEVSAIGRTIFTVTARDPDEGNNGIVEYELTADTNATFGGQRLFSIDQANGIVKVAQELHGRAGYYYITVQASDKGTERRVTTERYIIEVYDVNDAFPRFVNPNPNNTVVSVQEGKPNGTLIIQLSAEDSDLGRNGLVMYTLDPEQEAVNLQAFALNATSGELTTKITMDRETKSEYKLKVRATDHGIPTNFTTNLLLTILVRDVNDEPPMFDRNTVGTPYQVSLKENVTSQSCVSVNVAVDRDSDSTFTVICYYLFGVELTDTFILDTSGSLCLKSGKILDREATAFTNLVVKASDDCNLGIAQSRMPPSGETKPDLFESADTSLLWVKVNVLDVNDFRPAFVRNDLALGITRDVQLGAIIYNLKEDATDRDTEQWGVSSFINLTEFQAHPSRLAQELADMKVVSPFILFPNGSVKVNTYFNADMSGYFIVTVRVIDKGGLTGDAELRISLISDSQRLKVVFREGVAQVGNYRAVFAQRMSAVTGYRIVVDKVQTHENANNMAENDKTDMFIHGEDVVTNEIIPAVSLLRSMDELSADGNMIRLLNDFNILEIVETRPLASADEKEKRLQMALILVSVILGVLCISLAVALYLMHKKYTRKLKAATALAYGPQETDLIKVDIPGTNMHSYENSNPIYLEKIMLEGDDDGQNSLDENTLIRQTLPGFDEQEVCMNIFPDYRHHHRRASQQKTKYLKAAISEHETSKNLQANDLAKNGNGDKMVMTSSASPSPTSASTNNSVEESDGTAEGGFNLSSSVRPIVINAGSSYEHGDHDDSDRTVTYGVNGMPSTEI